MWITDRVGWGLDSFAKLRSCHGLAPALVFDGSRHDPDEWSRRVGKGLLKLASCRMRGPQSGGLWFGGKSAGFQAENSTWALRHSQRCPVIDFQRCQAPSDLGLLRFFKISKPCSQISKTCLDSAKSKQTLSSYRPSGGSALQQFPGKMLKVKNCTFPGKCNQFYRK